MKNLITDYRTKYTLITYCLLLGTLFFPLLSSAQTRGKLEVVKDPLIDTFIVRRASLNKSGLAGAETANGYRVQIFFGSNRQAAYNAQTKFKEEYPELLTYITYSEPNFKVHAGDFRTRLEAEKLLKEVSGMFPSLFIIAERINPPKNESE